jgi:tetratricopeptide (TPR) repeat protein
MSSADTTGECGPGVTLGRYQILEKIGAGGMGEVFRAHDQHLDRDVAIKLLPRGTLGDETARKRFHKEALALSKLNHPNVATIHDFDTQQGVDFLVMEYIPGITLSEELASGPLREKQVVTLGMQLAQGLSTAHEQGVLHCDLKPANLRLTGDGRLKILDFGLAKLRLPTTPTAPTVSLSESQAVAGTLPYMAPEQLRGEASEARTDVWAAGAVLYEMATGRRPFPETNSSLLIHAILSRDPEPPSRVRREVSSGLENVILKALEKDPANRYPSARELGNDLQRIAAGASPVAKRRMRTRLPLIATGAALVFLGAVLGGYFFLRIRKPVGPHEAAVKLRPSVAVLGFKNLSGRADLAWLSTALSEMLTTELAAGEQLRTTPGESVAQMKISLALPDADSFSKETLAKIRQDLGIDEVVLGSYVPLGEGLIRLDLRLQDAVAGETQASVSEKGPAAQLDELVGKAGVELRAKLGVGGLSQAETETVKASIPSNPAAALVYAQGLAKLRAFDTLGARELLEKATALEPNFSLSHDALATVWEQLGYDAKARKEAQRAFELSAGLSREERLAVEARYRATTNDWEKAVEIYRTLFNFFPDDLDYGLQLARLQNLAGKGQEAGATIELLRKFPPPQRDDPRIDIAEAETARSAGDFPRTEAAATRAAAKGQAQGSRLVVAQALAFRCMALRHLGKTKEAIPACEQAQSIYADAGNSRGVAMALTDLANNYYDQGDLAGAKKTYEQTLATYRQIGNQQGIAGALDNLANVLGDLGDLDGARSLSEQSLKIYREIDDSTGMAETLNNIATEQTLQGDVVSATNTLQQALAIWRKNGDKNGLATALNNLGDLLFTQGELARATSDYQESLATFRESGQKGQFAYPLAGWAGALAAEGDLGAARAKYEEALAISRDTADKHESATALFGLASVIERQGDLVTARQHDEEALAIRKEIGEKGTQAESVLALAELTVEEGHSQDAETLARQALGEFQAEKLREDEILASAVLARALMAQNKPAGASKEIEPAAGLAAQTSAIEPRLSYAIAAARIKAATGSVAEAITSLEAGLADASKHGYPGYQYEIRLALGEIEMKLGNAAAGHRRLNDLEKDARARGFLLIARKAATANKPPS